MKKGRTFFALRNAIVTGIVTFLNFPIQFINRYFMVHYLGITYLGLTSLFTNILSVLSLADLGIGTSIVFLLYTPLAKKDFKKVAIIMGFYKKIYRIIAIVIFSLGLLVLPFLKNIVGKSINYPHVYILFIIYLLGTVSSYLFSYNQSLLYADQKNHIISWINLIVTYVMLSIQVMTVIFFKNPLLYAALFVFSSFITNIVVSIFVNNIYHLERNDKIKEQLSLREKNLLKHNIIGNMFLRVSGVVVTGTDNIFLSVFAGVTSVGLYANYVTLTNVIQRIMTQMIGAVTGSIGNYIAQKDENENRKLFFNLQFINFMFDGMSCLGICFLSNDVITLWLGHKYIINNLDILLIALSFYVMNYRMLGWNFIAVYGLARYMKVFSINEMIANILFTLVFLIIFKLKLTGILLGTIFSTLFTVTWQDPYVIFHHAFHKSCKEYFKKYIYNFLILVIEFCILYSISCVLMNQITTRRHFILMTTFVVSISILIPYLFYINSSEIKYLKSIFNKILKREKI